MKRVVLILMIVVAMLPLGGFAQRSRVKPSGFNMISRDQEIQLGRDAAMQIERQMPTARDGRVEAIGRRLVRYSANPNYPYTFKVVRDNRINAFALPGGPIYINTGTIQAAQNESMLAGVIAHEIAHVALRYATNNISKAMLAQMPLSILSGLIGSGSVAAQLAQMGLGFGANSILLKYSRDAERQADIAAVQMLTDAGYDPNQMVRFFELMERGQRGRSVEFLSSHPNPGNRSALIRNEIARTGGRQRYQ